MFDREELYGPTGKPSGVGEVYDAPRRSTTPRTKPAATGRHVCGTREDFERGAAYDPTIAPRLYRPDGLPTCCLPGRGLLIGGAARGRTGGGLLLSSTTRPMTTSGLLIGGPARRTSLGLYIRGTYPRFCDTYLVSESVGGDPLLFRIDGDQPGWWNDTIGGTILLSATPETLEPWLLSGFGATTFWTSGTWWDGIGTRTFTRTSGFGPSTVDVTCAD